MLNVLALDAAQTLLLSQIKNISSRTEPVSLALARGRVLALDLMAKSDVPDFDRSQVDGFAVRAEDTFGASESLPAMLSLIGEVAMGTSTNLEIGLGECAYVPTGGMIPQGADAMVMIEHTESFDPTLRLISQRVAPGQSITKRGDDCLAGQTLLLAGHILRSADLGALAALGQKQVEVIAPVRIAFLSTGDELVDVSQSDKITAGQIIDVNRPMLIAAAEKLDATISDYGIISDQLDLLLDTIKKATLENELIIISGGSSVGSRDYVEQAINQAGQPGVLLHGIAVKPGKPTLAGNCDGKLVIGLPGHPVAAWFMFDQLVKPLILAMSGRQTALDESPARQARLTMRLPSNHGREEFVLVRLIKDPDQTGKWLAEPIVTRSGLVTQLTSGDGYLRIPRDSEGLETGTLVDIHLIKD